MDQKLLILVMCGAVALVGACEVLYQIYQMTVADAAARGLRHPKLWGLLAMNGNNSSGLLLYLIGRRNYPLTNVSEASQQELERRKKSAGVGLVFLTIGAIGMIVAVLL